MNTAVALVPIEIHELTGRVSPLKILTLIIELAVVVYLRWALRRFGVRGYHALNGDTDLAYQGDPVTAEPTDVPSHGHHIWRVGQVRELVSPVRRGVRAGHRPQTRCMSDSGGQPEDEFDARHSERDLIAQLHRSQEDDRKEASRSTATAPLATVVNEIDSRPIRRFSHALSSDDR